MLLEPRPLDAPVPTARRTWPWLLGGCLALAALSLLLPSTPTYDPWSWIIWGREILHLDLVTDTGPSWKPLPALFTVPFALFGGAAPFLWLVVARAGGLLGLVWAYRVARRLGGPFAGGAVVGALVLAPWYLKNSALGNSEGLMAAAVLGAIDRHLAGHRRQAFGLGLAAALLRPEAWPFFGLYGLWLVWRERSALRLVALGFLSLPLLWFGPEYWGSGNLNRASDRAQTPNANSPAFADHPALEVLGNAGGMLSAAVLVGAGAAVVALLLARRRIGRDGWTVLGITAMGLAWLGIVAVMTSRGFSGNQRYLVMPVVLLVLAGSVGSGWLVRLLPRVGDRAGARARRPGGRRVQRALLGAGPAPSCAPSSSRATSCRTSSAPSTTRAARRRCGLAGPRAPARSSCRRSPGTCGSTPARSSSSPSGPGSSSGSPRGPGSNAVPPLRTLGPGPVTTLAQRGNWRLLGACG